MLPDSHGPNYLLILALPATEILLMNSKLPLYRDIQVEITLFFVYFKSKRYYMILYFLDMMRYPIQSQFLVSYRVPVFPIGQDENNLSKS